MADTPIAPTPVGAWPTAPQRTDPPATFVTRADAWVSATPTRSTEMNALATNVNFNANSAFASAGEAAASADSAAASVVTAQTAVTNAQAAQAAAEAASSATLWVSGTTYAIGDVVYSPSTLLSYRRKTAGAGTTDPSGDTTNWQALSPSPAIIRVARTSNTIITSANVGNLIDITGGTFTQTFDSAATLGSDFFCYIKNSGTGVVTLGITLDGVASPTLRNNEYVIVQTNGTSFYTASKVAGSSGASLVYLSTTTGSGVAAIDVETGFSSVYDNYVIWGVGLSTSALETIRAQWKISGAYVTTSTYITATLDTTVSTTATTLDIVSPPSPSAAGGSLRYEIFQVNSASAKTASAWGVLRSSTPAIRQARVSHFNSETGAITGVKFLVAAGTMSGTFYLYGVRK